jgi:tetratricopeptide (TPR) repeat protein
MALKPRISPKGISVHWLKHGFMEEVHKAGFTEKSKIYEIENLSEDKHGVIRSKGANVKCPQDGKLGAAYVDCLKGIHNVGPSNCLLSYCWDYTIGDIVQTLDGYCTRHNKNPEHTFVWICCLCNNQHRIQEVPNVPFEEFRTIFHNCVTSIGHIVAMMTPWNQPGYLTRVWCIFELFTAHSNDFKITVEMPPEEKQKMVNALTRSPKENDPSLHGIGNGAVEDEIDILFKVLDGTMIEGAKATQPTDREHIMKIVEEGVGSTKLNIVVNGLLRDWVMKSLEETVEEEKLKYGITLEYANLCDSVGRVMFANAKYDKARTYYNKAERARVEILGKGHKYTVSHCNNIGNVLLREGDLNGSLKLYNEALHHNEENFGDNNKVTADSNREVGVILSRKGDYQGSLVKLRKALAIYENVLGDENVECALTHNSIGRVLDKTGDLNGALHSLQKALTIFQNVLGDDHVQTARAHRYVGGILGRKGDIDEAIMHFHKSLKTFEKELGDHHETGLTHNALGIAYRDKSSRTLDTALKEFRKGLQIYKKVLPNEGHKDTADIYNNIGSALWKKGDFDGALEEHQKALGMRQELFGDVSHKAAISHENLGLVHYSKDFFEKAKEEFNRALEIKIELLGEGHPSTASSYTSVGLVLDKVGDLKGALDYFQKAEKVRLKVLGEKHPETAKSFFLIGDIYKKQGKFGDATVKYKSALRIQEKALGKKHPSTRKTLKRLSYMKVVKN